MKEAQLLKNLEELERVRAQLNRTSPAAENLRRFLKELDQRQAVMLLELERVQKGK